MNQGSAGRIAISLSWDPISLEQFISQPRVRRAGAAGVWDMFVDVLDILTFKRISRFYYRHHYERVVKLKNSAARDNRFRHYDLDLYCYIYDMNHEFVTVIGPESSSAIETSGTVYHSGDNFSGHGYDEQIYIEINGLPKTYQHFIIAVKSDCRYNLNQIDNIAVKIADSKTEKVYFETILQKSRDSEPYGYVVAHLSRQTGDMGIRPIHAFINDKANWNILPQEYIK